MRKDTTFSEGIKESYTLYPPISKVERTPVRSNKALTISAKLPSPLYATRDTADSVAVREYAVGCAQGDAP